MLTDCAGGCMAISLFSTQTTYVIQLWSAMRSVTDSAKWYSCSSICTHGNYHTTVIIYTFIFYFAAFATRPIGCQRLHVFNLSLCLCLCPTGGILWLACHWLPVLYCVTSVPLAPCSICWASVSASTLQNHISWLISCFVHILYSFRKSSETALAFYGTWKVMSNKDNGGSLGTCNVKFLKFIIAVSVSIFIVKL